MRSTASSVRTAPGSPPPCTCSPPSSRRATAAPGWRGSTSSARARASASRSERPCRRPRSTPFSPRTSTCASRARSTGCRRPRGSGAVRSCSPASGWSRPPTARWAPTRAECAAGSIWPSRSCTSRASCFSTSRPPASTRRAAARCGRRSSAWRARTASPSSSPPSTSRRPIAWPTGWASSTMAGSSPRARPTSSRPRSARRASRPCRPGRRTASGSRACWRASPDPATARTPTRTAWRCASTAAATPG